MLRVATFNVRHCTRPGRAAVVDLDHTVAAIASLEADIVAVQELDVGRDRSGNIDQPAELAERLDMHVAFSQSTVFSDGPYGHALLSRSRIGFSSMRLPGGGEPRSLLHCRTAGIEVMSTHLTTDPATAMEQLDFIASSAMQSRTRPIVMGDLNLSRFRIRHLALGIGLVLRPGPTFPRETPYRQIDHIIVPDHFTPISVETVKTPVSDHRAVVAEIARRDT